MIIFILLCDLSVVAEDRIIGCSVDLVIRRWRRYRQFSLHFPILTVLFHPSPVRLPHYATIPTYHPLR